MANEPEWSEVGPDHPMTMMINSLVEEHREICARARISPWDFCVVLANAQGIILGNSHDMQTHKALERIKKLGEVAAGRVNEARAPETSGTMQ